MARNRASRKVAVGVGLGLLAAAAVAGYLLSGKRGEKNRKKIKAWAENAKKEIAAQLKKLKQVNKAAYNRVVDEVSRKYKAVKSVDPKELEAMVRDVKRHWQNIQQQVAREAAKTKKGSQRKH